MADRMNIKFTIQAVDRFSKTMGALDRRLDSLKRKTDNIDLGKAVEIDVDTRKATTAVEDLRKRIQTLDRRESKVKIDVDTGDAISDIAGVAAAVRGLPKRYDVDLNVNQREAIRELERIDRKADEVERERTIRMIVLTNYRSFRRDMDRIATSVRNIGEVFAGMGKGIALTFSSLISPIVASTTGMIGSLGVMIGTSAGATLGLASAFTAGATGAALFAAVAIPAIGGVIERADEIADLEEKMRIAEANGDFEKANELLAEMDGIFDGMTESQREAHTALTDFKDTYSQLVSDMEPGVLTAFAGGLTAIQTIFEKTRPTIELVVESVNNLMDALNRNLESPDVQEFFDYLEVYAAPSLERLTQAVGNFIVGFMNVMSAFGPLSESVSGGFLDMSESFRKWSDGLSQSEAFQNFTDYVSRNFPVIRGIVGDAIMGIVETFKAFAPYAEDWMQKTRDMMGAFRDFAEGLGENQQFQEFVQYIRDNAPAVTELIGNIIETLVNIGIAMAPLGSFMLGVANAILEWIINFREANPQVATFLAGVVGLFGAVMALAAPFWLVVKVVMTFAQTLLPIIGLVARVGFALLRFAGGPVAWIITAVVAMAIAIYKHWDEIVAFAEATWTWLGEFLSNIWTGIKEGARLFGEGVKTSITTAFDAVASFFSTWWSNIKEGWSTFVSTNSTIVRDGFNLIKDTILNILTTIWDGITHFMGGIISIFTEGVPIIWGHVKTGFNNIREAVTTAMLAVVSKITTSWVNIKSKFSEAVANVKEKVRGGFEAIKTKVNETMTAALTYVRTNWDSIKTKVQTAVADAKSKVSEGFEAIKTKISETLSNALQTVRDKFESMLNAVKVKLDFVKSAVTSAWNEVLEFLRGIDLFSIGADIMGGMVEGIKSMAGSLKTAAEGVVDGIKGGVKRILKSNSPSKLYRDIGIDTMEGMRLGILKRGDAVIQSAERIAEKMTKAFNPNLDAAVTMSTANGYNGYSTASAQYANARASQAEERRTASRTTVEVPVYLHGKEIARASNDEQKRMNERESARIRKFSGGGVR